MGIQSLSIMDDATAQAAPTGGTTLTLVPDGVSVPNGIHVSDSAALTFLTKLNATFRNRVPVLQSDGTYSKAKRSMLIVKPKLLADGSYAYNLVRTDIEFHPECSVAEVQALRYLGSQLCSDSDMDGFIVQGSLS